MRPARGLAGAAALALGLALAPAPVVRAQAEAPAVTLTLPQVRSAIAAAAARGDAGLVRLLARGLDAAGQADGEVYFLWAQAEAAAGAPAPALDAAGEAYRRADTGRQRYQAAQLAARSAFAAGQPTTAQLWLRRTYEHAEGDKTREAIARDYRMLRAINPLSFRLNLGASPSSNVNNGAGSRLNYIDGVPAVGVLSPTAQALSGVEYTADLAFGYRLGALSRDRKITAVGRVYTRQVRLSEESRTLAPSAENGDFAHVLVQGGIRGQFRLGDDMVTGGGLVAGQSWYGGENYYHFARAEAEWSRDLTAATAIGVSGYFERRLYDNRPTTEAVAQLGLGLTQVLPGGSRLRARLTFQNANLTGTTRDNHAVSARLDWTPADPIGPVSLSLGVSANYSDHPDYQVGFISVPGGRQDTSYGADIRMSFDRLDYAGFVPVLDIGLSRTESNVSRFETEEVSVGFGIRSAF